jgi:hypothetical protein
MSRIEAGTGAQEGLDLGLLRMGIRASETDTLHHFEAPGPLAGPTLPSRRLKGPDGDRMKSDRRHQSAANPKPIATEACRIRAS